MDKCPPRWVRINEFMYHYKEYMVDILSFSHYFHYKWNNLQQLEYV